MRGGDEEKGGSNQRGRSRKGRRWFIRENNRVEKGVRTREFVAREGIHYEKIVSRH